MRVLQISRESSAESTALPAAHSTAVKIIGVVFRVRLGLGLSPGEVLEQTSTMVVFRDRCTEGGAFILGAFVLQSTAGDCYRRDETRDDHVSPRTNTAAHGLLCTIRRRYTGLHAAAISRYDPETPSRASRRPLPSSVIVPRSTTSESCHHAADTLAIRACRQNHET